MILDSFRDYLVSAGLTDDYRVQKTRWQEESLENQTGTDDTKFMVLKNAGGLKPDLDYFTPYVEIILIGIRQSNGSDLEQRMQEIMSYMQSSYNTEVFAIIEPTGQYSPVVFTEEERPVTTLTVRLINQM